MKEKKIIHEAAIAFVGAKRILKNIWTPSKEKSISIILARARFSERPCAVNNRREKTLTSPGVRIYTHRYNKTDVLACNKRYMVLLPSITYSWKAPPYLLVKLLLLLQLPQVMPAQKLYYISPAGQQNCPLLSWDQRTKKYHRSVRSIYEKVTNAGTHTRRAPGTG